MLRRLTARWRLWKVALVGKDDPEGEYLLKMGGRVRLAGSRSGAVAPVSRSGYACRGDVDERPGGLMTEVVWVSAVGGRTAGFFHRHSTGDGRHAMSEISAS